MATHQAQPADFIPIVPPLPSTTKFQDSRHLITIRKTATKGFGIFAVSPIPRGTCILAENSLLVTPDRQIYARAVLDSYAALSPDKQAQYLTLHQYTGHAFRTTAARELDLAHWDDIPVADRVVLGVWAANSWDSVLLTGSRFNHSCVPNAAMSSNDNEDLVTFHAVADIAEGEEVTIAYTSVARSRIDRGAVLMRSWGIDCKCVACEGTEAAAEGEVRRVELGQLKEVLIECHTLASKIPFHPPPAEEGLKAAERYVELMEMEGIKDGELSEAYAYPGFFSAKLGNASVTLSWLEKEQENERHCVGHKSPFYTHLIFCQHSLSNSVSVDIPICQFVQERYAEYNFN